MRFNYAIEKKKFDMEWAEKLIEMRAAGMTESEINEMYQYDWGWFKSKRNFALNTTPYSEDSEFNDNTDDLILLGEKKKRGMVDPNKDIDAVLNLEDAISNSHVLQAYRSLKPDDKDLLHLYVILKFTVTEIAQIQGTTKQNICNKILRIKKYFKKFL
jgi:DNA-directed RNA polymerase specialized sigma subunit